MRLPARYLPAALVLLAAVQGCRDDAVSPTSPPAAADVAATSAPLSFRQVTVGGFVGSSRFHACGVTTDDLAYCWGDNSAGQLGIGGGTNGPDDCFGSPCSKRPRLVVGDHRWKHVRAGDRFTCGITTDNVAWCWGNGSQGQLGNSNILASTGPIKVSGHRNYRQIRVGVAHACAITTTDSAFCWGYNQFGQVG